MQQATNSQQKSLQKMIDFAQGLHHVLDFICTDETSYHETSAVYGNEQVPKSNLQANQIIRSKYTRIQIKNDVKNASTKECTFVKYEKIEPSIY